MAVPQLASELRTTPSAPMSPELVIKLVPILEAYFSLEEMREIASMFDVALTSLEHWQPQWLAVARELSEKLDHGNTRRLVDSVVELASTRNDEGLAHATFERLILHQNM